MTEGSSIQSSIDALNLLGKSLDAVAARVEAGDHGEALTEMVDGLTHAEAQIAELVVESGANEQLSEPRLVALKYEWLGRFERFFSLIEYARSRLDGEAELRLTRYRASDAYLKNQAP